MKLRIVLSLLIVTLLSGLAPNPLAFQSCCSDVAIAREELTLEQAQQILQQSQGFFTENKGQWDEEILFKGKVDFGNVVFTREAVYYQMIKSEGSTKEPFDPEMKGENYTYSTQIIKLSFVNAGDPEVRGLELLPHYHNYMIGNDASKWGIRCRNFAQVTYDNIWDGIDLSYFFTLEGLKYEYYVHPHANMENLKVQVEGAELGYDVDALYMETALGTLKDDKLVVFGQDTGDMLNVNFKAEANLFSFAGLPDDRAETVVIDPLVYATFLGGYEGDTARSIAVDSSGHAYITGYTASSDFPMDATVGGIPAPGYDQTFTFGQDSFIVKLNEDGTELIYTTFLGGSQWDHARAIAIDEQGCAYITGQTYSDDFPMDATVEGIPAPGYDQAHNSGFDAFAVKIDPTGTQLLYATYLGGSSTDDALSIAVNHDGQAFITGRTRSDDFPMETTVGGIPAPGYDQTQNGNWDAFVVKLNETGTELLYATYLGGSLLDYAHSIAIDEYDQAYVTGWTESVNFPMNTTIGGDPAPGYHQSFTGGRDAFVVKLNETGTELLYATYLGGSEMDYAYSIAVNNDGEAFVAGFTYSSDFPMNITVGGEPAPGYHQIYSGTADAFVVKLNETGTELLYATYLGGSGEEYTGDYAYALAIDEYDQAYIAGWTSTSNFPMDATVGGEPAPGHRQSYFYIDSFVAVLNDTGTELVYATYLGGNQWDWARSIAVDEYGDIYVVGDTRSSDFVMLRTMDGDPAPGYDQTYNNSDAFAVKITMEEMVDPSEPDPGQDTSPPHLRIWAEVSKPTFFKGEEAMLFVTVANQGEEPATHTRVTVTIPRETRFLRATRYRSQILTPEMIEIEMGTIAPLSVQSFQVDLMVEEAVAQPRTLPVFFDVTCAEESNDFTHVMLQLVPQRSGQPDLYLGLYYRNAQWDPQTGSLFIAQNATLEIDFVLTGARLPYDLTIDWGDGDRTSMNDQQDVRQTLQHTFRSKGLMQIKVQVTDQLSRTRTANLQMEVR